MASLNNETWCWWRWWCSVLS